MTAVPLDRERQAIDAEGGLRMSPDLCQALFQQNPHPLWVRDVDTLEFLDVNEAAVRRYGYSHAEFLALRIGDIWASEDMTADIDTGRGAGQPARTPRHRLKTGEIINVEIASYTVTYAGRPAILESSHDVTDRARAETERNLLAAIVEDCEDAIVGTVDGIVVSWNAAAALVYGYTRDEAIGQHLSLFIPAEGAAELPDLLARLQRGERLAHYETERRRKDGSTVPVSLTLPRTDEVEAARQPTPDGQRPLGGDGTILLKPFTATALARSVRECLEAHPA